MGGWTALQASPPAVHPSRSGGSFGTGVGKRTSTVRPSTVRAPSEGPRWACRERVAGVSRAWRAPVAQDAGMHGPTIPARAFARRSAGALALALAVEIGRAHV